MHRRKPRERQRVGQRLHSQVGVEQHVQSKLRDLLSRSVHVRRDHDILIRLLAIRLRQLVLVRRGRDHGDVKVIARKLFNQPVVQPADRVISKIAGNKPDLDAPACARRNRRKLRVGGCAIQLRDAAMNLQIVHPLISGCERRHRQMLRQIQRNVLRGQRLDRINQPLSPREHLIARCVDRREHRRQQKERRRIGIARLNRSKALLCLAHAPCRHVIQAKQDQLLIAWALWTGQVVREVGHQILSFVFVLERSNSSIRQRE